MYYYLLLTEITTSDISAEQPYDYTQIMAVEVTFPVDTPSVDVPITTIADGYFEHDELFGIELHSPTNGGLGVLYKHVVIIHDKDTPGKHILDAL